MAAKKPKSAPRKTGMRKGLTAYGDEGFSLFLRKAFIKAMGYTDDALDRPIVGITNTFSGFNACHRNVPDLIEAVKRGVMLAGGLPDWLADVVLELFAIIRSGEVAEPLDGFERLTGREPTPIERFARNNEGVLPQFV